MKALTNCIKRSFSAKNGPYNPYTYKQYTIAKTLPKKDEIHPYLESMAISPEVPERNMRHINPLRQSGPLPAYHGSYTMEDIRGVMVNPCVGADGCNVQVHPEEIMRRVPGITRKEAEFIGKLGLRPDEQIDYAYIAYNLGLDVFYLGNQMFIARQVVTNSKCEKVEILWSAQSYEDLAFLNVGFAPVLENVDYHWELFLWNDPPITVHPELDMCVPNTWFEYEMEYWGELCILEDQMSLPEDIRVFPSPRNPYSTRELWKSQEKLEEEQNMLDENWYPENTKYNIYNQKGFKAGNHK